MKLTFNLHSLLAVISTGLSTPLHVGLQLGVVSVTSTTLVESRAQSKRNMNRGSVTELSNMSCLDHNFGGNEGWTRAGALGG